jgi:hypothetical protein
VSKWSVETAVGQWVVGPWFEGVCWIAPGLSSRRCSL